VAPLCYVCREWVAPFAWPLFPGMYRLYIGVRTITGGEWFLFAQTSPLPTSTCQGPNTCAREGKIDAYLHFTEEQFMYTLQGRVCTQLLWPAAVHNGG